MMANGDQMARILFVEDDIGKRYVIARQLRAAGFQVDEATTGREGLDAITPEHDVAILDMRLPDMSGWDVCRHIKENPVTDRVMVLALSATYVTPKDRASGLERGADVYLVHPVEMVELIACLNSLVRLRRAIEDRDVQQELFIATVGHDIRSPLAVQQLAIEMLRISRNLDDRDRALIDKIERGTTRIKLLTDQLLRMMRSLTGEEVLERREVDLEALVCEMIAQLSESDKVHFAPPGEPVRISGDPVPLSQLIENLIGNALRHGEGVIEVRLFNDDDEACLVVHNQGAPIAPESLDKLFHPFKQGSKDSRGYGLGLYIVDRIAKEHGGSVAVTSNDETGTAFVVRLPIQDG